MDYGLVQHTSLTTLSYLRTLKEKLHIPYFQGDTQFVTYHRQIRHQFLLPLGWLETLDNREESCVFHFANLF